jgi:hypothetical protein
MNSDLIIFIDGYLSTPERAKVCSELIDQIKSVSSHKIALLNKYSFSWGLDSKIDHYFNHNEGFMMGPPPQEILDKELYERPYVYVNTSIGTFENWLPFTGVSDHVANMFNSFILTSEAAKILGYKRIFRIEADTKFDINELKEILKDVALFKDYLLYGERQEGDWAKPHHRIMDMHMIGYSINVFDSFNLLKNDSDFWDLCKQINYYGKWIEYIIPTTIYWQKQKTLLEGINHPGSVRDKYPNTKFDLINNPGGWVDKWKNIPKICKIKTNTSEVINKIGLFYWNDEDNLEVECKIINLEGKEIYNKNISLNPFTWFYDELDLEGEYTIINKNIRNGLIEEFTNKISLHNISELNTRLIKK